MGRLEEEAGGGRRERVVIRQGGGMLSGVKGKGDRPTIEPSSSGIEDQ